MENSEIAGCTNMLGHFKMKQVKSISMDSTAGPEGLLQDIVQNKQGDY